MAIIEEETILGQDTELEFETETLTLVPVLYEEYGGGLSYEQEDFRVAQSTVAGFVTPMKATPQITFRGKRGLAETFTNLKRLFDSEKLTGVSGTDFPDHATMVAEYGEPKVVSVNFSQPAGQGTYDVTVRWGYRQHGYTPV